MISKFSEIISNSLLTKNILFGIFGFLVSRLKISTSTISSEKKNNYSMVNDKNSWILYSTNFCKT